MAHDLKLSIFKIHSVSLKHFAICWVLYKLERNKNFSRSIFMLQLRGLFNWNTFGDFSGRKNKQRWNSAHVHRCRRYIAILAIVIPSAAGTLHCRDMTVVSLLLLEPCTTAAWQWFPSWCWNPAQPQRDSGFPSAAGTLHYRDVTVVSPFSCWNPALPRTWTGFIWTS
jgi:hypothetical protein